MPLSPRMRARRAAAREIQALAAHTPCLRSPVPMHHAVFRIEVDLPFLAWDPRARAPREHRGFKLAVRLPATYPDEPPWVAFLSDEMIFHPAVSPRLATFCIGNSAWAPDVGLAHFVVCHLEAVLGLVEIDTMDALFLDPLCQRAAVHYRQLRETGGLPLARPVFSTRPARQASDRGVSSPRPSTAARQRRARPGVRGVGARGPRGRRIISLQAAQGFRLWTATCVLDGERWGASAGAESARSLRWLGQRLASRTELALVQVDGAPALQMTREGPGAPSGEELRAIFEEALRCLELPISSLAEPVVARAVDRALRDCKPCEFQALKGGK